MMLNKILKKPCCSKRGATMVFFAILLPMIFGFMGLGIDASLVYVNKGKVQDIADAAALAGAAHLGEEGDSVRTAVEKYVKANGVDITSNDMVSVPSDGWDSLDELDDDKSLRVAYGVVNVDGKDRLRVRIDKRVPLPFTSAFIPDWSKGMPVSSVAAAEGGAVEVPPFRIIGRNGVYDNFFDLTNGDEDESKRWLDGSIYAGNMLRVSYKTRNPADAKNMFSVNGYIFADRLNTGLPLINGVYKDSDGVAMERIFRSSYVRKKDGENCLYGQDALSPTNMTVPSWGCTATEKAESCLQAYSAQLTRLINNKDIKTKCMLGEGKNRYMCNEGVHSKLSEEMKRKLHPDGRIWKNKQYSNIDKEEKNIDTLYVEIQGDRKDHNVKDSRDAAIWLGAWPHADKINKVERIIVELHKTDSNTGASDLTGSFIINLGHNGVMEIGPIYSQANLIVRAAYNGDKDNCIRFTNTVFSEKVLSFSYDDLYAGGGYAHHRFAPEVVLAANLVLFGYGYEIGPNVIQPSLNNPMEITTYHYDDLTNYMDGAYTVTEPENSDWWTAGLSTIDNVNNSGSTVYELNGLNLTNEEDIKKNPNAQEELRLLKILWGCVDKDTKHIYDLPSKYGPKHGTVNAYSLYGSLYGELGRWPTELQTNVGSDKASSHLLNCPMESIPGIESVSGKLRLVE